MKKLITAITLCLISVTSIYSQISSEVETVKKKYDVITYCHSPHSKIMQYYPNCIYRDEGYYLVVTSDNQFEDKALYIKLGTTEEQVIESLRNINAIYNKMVGTNEHFKIGIYTCQISNERIYFQKPAYSAGYYYIEPTKFNKLADECDAEYKEHGKFFILEERKEYRRY